MAVKRKIKELNTFEEFLILSTANGTLHGFFQLNPESITARKISDAILDFVVRDAMPLNVVESPSFRALIRTLDKRYTVPSRKL